MSSAPGPAVPVGDDKDWTWVIRTACPACGFDPSTIDRALIGDRIVSSTPRWQQALSAADAAVRPLPQVWSALEYGCHVRDVHRLFGQRARLILDSDDPEFDNWDQDETAVAERYWTADPAEVAIALATSARTAAAVFAGASGRQWDRTGRRSNGSVFTLQTLGMYYLHDVEHHLYDVGGTRV